jgi:hypothetical protein
MPHLIESSHLSVHVYVAKMLMFCYVDVLLCLCGSLCSVTTTVAMGSDDIIIT